MAQQDTDSGYWREYRLGPLAEAAHVTVSVLVAVAVGLGASFACLLLIGLAGEEELLVGLTDVVDDLTRASLGVLIGMGLACWALYVAADSLRSVGVSRALVRAADDGADPRAVPHPAQVEAVVVAPHTRLVVLLGVAAAMALLVAGVSVGEHDTGLVLVGVAVTAVCAAGTVAAYVVSRPAHRRRRRRIAEHWTAHWEQTAWGHARNASGTRRGRRAGGDDPWSATSGTLRRGIGLLVVGAVAGMLSGALLELFLFVRYPGSVSTPGARLNDRGSFSPLAEAVLDGALWVVVVLGLAGLAVAVTGSVLAAAGLGAERAELVRRLDDPSATRPGGALLARHAGRRPDGLAMVGAGLGAFLLVPSLGVLSVLRGDADTAEVLAGLSPYAVTGTVTGVLLVVAALVANAVVTVRDHPLRDRLQQRWPVLPRRPDDKTSVRYAVRTRPTLHREDVGLW